MSVSVTDYPAKVYDFSKAIRLNDHTLVCPGNIDGWFTVITVKDDGVDVCDRKLGRVTEQEVDI